MPLTRKQKIIARRIRRRVARDEVQPVGVASATNLGVTPVTPIQQPQASA